MSKTPVVLKKSFKLLFVSLHFFISSFKRLSRFVTEIRQHILNLFFNDALCIFHDAMPFFKVYMPFLR
jgi:hypothetical protein